MTHPNKHTTTTTATFDLFQTYLGSLLEKHGNNEPIYYEDLIRSWERVECMLAHRAKDAELQSSAQQLVDPDLTRQVHSLHESLLKDYENSARQYYQSILSQALAPTNPTAIADSFFPSLPTDFKSEKLDDYVERSKKHVMSLPSIAWARLMDEHTTPLLTGQVKIHNRFHLWRVSDALVDESFWVPFRAEAAKRYKEGLHRRLEHLRMQKKSKQTQPIQETTAHAHVGIAVEELQHPTFTLQPHDGHASHEQRPDTSQNLENRHRDYIKEQHAFVMTPCIDHALEPDQDRATTTIENVPSLSVNTTAQSNVSENHVLKQTHTNELESTNDAIMHDLKHVFSDDNDDDDNDDDDDDDDNERETDHSVSSGDEEQDPIEGAQSGEELDEVADKAVVADETTNKVLLEESQATFKIVQSEQPSSSAPLTAAEKRLVRFAPASKGGLKSLSTSLHSTRSKTGPVGTMTADSASTTQLSTGHKTDRTSHTAPPSNRGSKRKTIGGGKGGSSTGTQGSNNKTKNTASASQSGSTQQQLQQQQQQQGGGRSGGRTRRRLNR